MVVMDKDFKIFIRIVVYSLLWNNGIEGFQRKIIPPQANVNSHDKL